MSSAQKRMHCYVYIDGANLHQWAKDRWWIDYQKFKKRLSDKYRMHKVYLFLWYIKGNELLYSQLNQLWYILIFKETLQVKGKVKWNCDAELVVQSVSQYFEENTKRVILVTGDGDFACLVEFFKQRLCPITLLAPNKNFCSYLLKKTNIPIVLLEEVQSNFKKIPQ